MKYNKPTEVTLPDTILDDCPDMGDPTFETGLTLAPTPENDKMQKARLALFHNRSITDFWQTARK